MGHHRGGRSPETSSLPLVMAFGAHLIPAGLLGPTIQAEVYDTVVVTLKNMASHPVSLHAVGVSFWKSSEGESEALLLPQGWRTTGDEVLRRGTLGVRIQRKAHLTQPRRGGRVAIVYVDATDWVAAMAKK